MKNVLVFKYGTSRGQDTYGYRLVSLWVDGEKVAKTGGGGYDMRGTVLGQYMNQRFHNEIKALASKEIKEAESAPNGYYNDKGGGIYGIIVTKTNSGVIMAKIDGMCGFSVCQEVLKLLGYELEYVTDTDKETIYQLHTQIN